MTKYTSLHVSKRLAEAGFKGPDSNTCYQTWPDAGFGWSIGSYDIYATSRVAAYQSDTLLEWLLEEGVGVYIDRKNGVDYVYLYGADAESVTAASLPDALGEVVLRVLAKEREP